MKYNINCDIGENEDKIDRDLSIISKVTAINLACGFHAGNHLIMSKIIKEAVCKEVCIGAHPGFDDKKNFGRVKMHLSDEALISLLQYQIGACKLMVEQQGGTLHHVKLHGALYNMVMSDQRLSEIVIKTVKNIDVSLIHYGMDNTKFSQTCKREGVPFMAEGFADRSYDEYLLVSRLEQGVIQSVEEVIQQGITLLKDHYVMDIHQNKINIKCETLCVHGDHEHIITILEGFKKHLE